MNRIIIIASICVFWACSGSSQHDNSESGIILSGSVGYPQDGIIILEMLKNNQSIPFDTLSLSDDNTFSTEVNLDHPGYYRLNFYNKQFVPLILDDEDVTVNVDGNQQQGFSEVKGSSDHDFISEVQQMFQTFQQGEAVQAINQQYVAAQQAGDQSTMNQLRDDYMELDGVLREKLMDKIDSLGASLGVVEILRGSQFLDKDRYGDFYHEYAQLLKKEIPDSEVAQNFVKEVENMKKLAIGQVAPEISLPNPDGEIVKLSSLRGNYVLLDFWAKWCKPCRMENPNVVRLYKKYNDKGFEVFGVSLDRKKEDWLQAIEQDGLTWTHVSDLKFWNSEAAQLYDVKAIPFALLLDPEGVIIGKNLRGKELENKLADIFDNEG